MDGQLVDANYHWHLHESKCCIFGASAIGVSQKENQLELFFIAFPRKQP